MQEKPFDCMHKKLRDDAKELYYLEESLKCAARDMCCQGVCQYFWTMCLPPSLHLDIDGLLTWKISQKLSHKCYSHPKRQLKKLSDKCTWIYNQIIVILSAIVTLLEMRNRNGLLYVMITYLHIYTRNTRNSGTVVLPLRKQKHVPFIARMGRISQTHINTHIDTNFTRVEM